MSDSIDTAVDAALFIALFLAIVSVLLAAWFIAGTVGAAGGIRVMVAAGIILLSLLVVA